MAVMTTYTRRRPEEGILFNAIRAQWPWLRAASRAANDGQGLPKFIDDAVADFLKCGLLKHGVVQAKCQSCNQSIVIAFSCKQRGICSSCAGKRRVELAAHLGDAVVPKVRMRQWVITFPHDIRYLLAWNNGFPASILAAVMHGLERRYITQARQ